MAYRLARKETVEAGIQRIVIEQIDKAAAEIENDALNPHEKVHQIRKRCKKIRGALRLVRPALGKTYAFENDWFRDTAGQLADFRDAEVLIETYDQVMEAFQEQVERQAFAPVRRALTQREKQRFNIRNLDHELQHVSARLAQAKERAKNWTLQEQDFTAVSAGLLKTYRRGRQALIQAYADPAPAQFHEWRKRVKYHRYHTRLLNHLWQPLMMEFWREVKTLSDLLGDDHDLAVLQQTLLSDPDSFGKDTDRRQALVGLINGRRIELEKTAQPLGERIYAEKPKHLRRRLGHYWRVWQGEMALSPTFPCHQ
jgi:CHAD domain-containing protein